MNDEIEVGTTPEIEDDSPSIEDTLRATWDDIQARDEGDEPGGPSRDERGRFAAAQTDQQVDPQQPAPDAQPATADLSVPPSSLNAQEKAEWASAGPALQAAFHRREQDFHNGISQYKGDAMWARQFYEMAPQMQELRELYGSEAVGVKTLLEISQFARDDPAGFVGWFARERGLNLSQNPANGVDNQQPQANDLLYQELTALRQRIDQQEYAQARVEAEDVLKEIQGFAGKPDAEHFEALRPAMAGLLQSGLANSLEEAYEKALWQSPDIRSQVLAKQQGEAAKKALEEARSKATRAKAARSGLSHRGNYGSKPSGKGATMEDTIRETLEQMGFQ